MADPIPEPWLRGPLAGVDPVIAPLLRSFEQVREELRVHLEGLTPEQVWARPHGMTPLGFQLRHIAGSVERLTTFLDGKQITEQQLAAKACEMEAGASVAELLEGIDRSFAYAESVVRRLDPARLADERRVGRLGLQTTVQGLLVHIAEHTQRHLGQAIAAAKLAKSTASSDWH
jgi:uncharacterized damage-inducible protein DinB